ncbi:hypothetical protein GH733_014928 [Mirounga leonina]|nr:hypothetical protein GH733_014928 [Mirounga leonina]
MCLVCLWVVQHWRPDINGEGALGDGGTEAFLSSFGVWVPCSETGWRLAESEPEAILKTQAEGASLSGHGILMAAGKVYERFCLDKRISTSAHEPLAEASHRALPVFFPAIRPRWQLLEPSLHQADSVRGTRHHGLVERPSRTRFHPLHRSTFGASYSSQPLDESWPRQQHPWKEEKHPGFRLTSALNRTNSDSALHTSALSAKPQDPYGGGGQSAWPAPYMGFCDGENDVHGEGLTETPGNAGAAQNIRADMTAVFLALSKEHCISESALQLWSLFQSWPSCGSAFKPSGFSVPVHPPLLAHHQAASRPPCLPYDVPLLLTLLISSLLGRCGPSPSHRLPYSPCQACGARRSGLDLLNLISCQSFT